MKLSITLILLLCYSIAFGQIPKTEVLTLGAFHFDFPNLDANQIAKPDQIDIFDSKYQNDIKDIVARIYKFKPTIIVIERQPTEQSKIDSLYNEYLQGKYQLKRAEDQQIGFRLAKMLGLKKLYCVDEWGNFNENINVIVNGNDSIESQKFDTYSENNPDSSKRFRPKSIYKSEGILASLRQLNDEKNIKKSLGNYLVGLFKYESKANDFKGVDFETGRWFNRNLKIFRNIQRIKTKTSDKILVIYGAGHLNLLNYFFECSPEYNLLKTNDYLK